MSLNSISIVKIYENQNDYDYRVGRIIRATQYPYVISTDELNIQQLIIRDADMCQSFEDTWFTHVLLGLSKELKIGLVEFIENQKRFISAIQFNTKWGLEKAEGKTEVLLNRLDKLSEVFDVSVVSQKKEYRKYKFNWNMPYTHLRTFKAGLLNNIDDTISKLTVDLVAEAHNISDNWKQQHNILTGREDEKLYKTTEKAILSLKKEIVDLRKKGCKYGR